ncbi:hypothetical protein [Halomonas sp.]
MKDLTPEPDDEETESEFSITDDGKLKKNPDAESQDIEEMNFDG